MTKEELLALKRGDQVDAMFESTWVRCEIQAVYKDGSGRARIRRTGRNKVGSVFPSVNRTADDMRLVAKPTPSPDVPPGTLLPDHHPEAMRRWLSQEPPGTLWLSGNGHDERIEHATLGTICRTGAHGVVNQSREIARVFGNLYMAHENLLPLLDERDRLLGILADCGLDGTLAIWRAGYEAGRKAAGAVAESTEVVT